MILPTNLTAEEIYGAAAAAGARPDPLLTISQWADRYRWLSQRASAEHGRWRTERTPYLREIMDCLSPMSLIERTVFMKGAQIGGTECGNNWMGYPPEQRHDQAGGPDCPVAVRRPDRGGGAIPERPSTRNAVFGGDRPEDAAIGHNAIRGEPRRARRKALSTSQLPGRPGPRIRLEHSDARRYRGGNLSHSRWPQHGRWQRRDVPLAEHQRQRCRKLHDRPVRHAAVRDRPGDGSAVFQLRPHAAVGQHAR